MQGYVCMRACKIGGVAYKVGDAVPFEAVDDARRKKIVRAGIVTIAPEVKEETEAATAETETPIADVEDDVEENGTGNESEALKGVKKPRKRKGG